MSAQSSNKYDALKAKLRHAFAVKDGEGFSPDDLAFMERIADFLCRRHLEAPVILGALSVKPLAFLGSQMLIFLQPLVGQFFNEADYQRLVTILSKREGMETFVNLVERRSAELQKGGHETKEHNN